MQFNAEFKITEANPNSLFCHLWGDYMWDKMPGQKSFPIQKIYARSGFVLSHVTDFCSEKICGTVQSAACPALPLDKPGQARPNLFKISTP